MYVAQNFISLSFNATDTNSATTVLTGDTVVDGESFNFAAILETNVGNEGLGGEFLPQPGSILPHFSAVDEALEALPQFELNYVAELDTNIEERAPAIVASLDIQAPAATLAAGVPVVTTQELPRDSAIVRRSGQTQPVFAEPASQRRVAGAPGTTELPGAAPQQVREVGQTVTQLLPQSTPEVGAVVRSIDTQTPNINRTAKIATLAAQPSLPIATDLSDTDATQQLTSLVTNRVQVQPPISAVPSNDVALEVGARQKQLNPFPSGAPGISFTAPLPTVGDKPIGAFVEVATSSINTPVRDAIWGDRINQQILTMAGNNTRTAEIRLTPAELGPLRIQVDLDDGKTNVAFQSHHAVTREAIETALPRLRELLAENGLALGEANVGERDRTDREQGRAESGSTDVELDVNGDSELDDDRESSQERRVSQGLLDAFV